MRKTSRTSESILEKKRPRAAMPVILRNAPPGYNWGWFSREDPRMHLQVVDRTHEYLHYKVWLESKGRRIFEPAGEIPPKILKKLKTEVEIRRESIEAEWVHFMIEQEWLIQRVNGKLMTVIAYPNNPNRFERTIDLAPHIGKEDANLFTANDVRLNSEFAVIELWPSRVETRRPFIFLPKILWRD